MDALSYSMARRSLAKVLDKVCRDHAPVIVTRQKKDSVVIMSLEDYESLEETAHLLRTPENARRLLESITQLESGTETLRLAEIPGIRDSIVKGMKEPLDKCSNDPGW